MDHIRRTPGWHGLGWPHADDAGGEPGRPRPPRGRLRRTPRLHVHGPRARSRRRHRVRLHLPDRRRRASTRAAAPGCARTWRRWTPVLYEAVRSWLAAAWPFHRVDYAPRVTYAQGPAGRRVHRRPARLAAGDLPAGARPGPRGRPRGRGDHQAHRPAVLRPGGQHLRAARREGPRQRVPLRRRDRPRPRGDHHRRPRQQDRPDRRRSAGTSRSTSPPCCAMFRQIIANNRAGGWRKLKGG